MNKLRAIGLLLLPLISLTQPISARRINITLDEFTCKFRDDMRPTAAHAFRIATAVFNSPEFQREISGMSFRHDSYCPEYDSLTPDSEERISGEAVLNRLFSEPDVAISLDLKARGSALGETSAASYLTTACYENIRSDMPEFEDDFAYALAVNVCHEYMHQVGFCHLYCSGWFCAKKDRLNEPNGKPDRKFINEDVTYKVGWVAFYIIKDWKRDKKKIE